MVITVQDIGWLRLAARTSRAQAIPSAIAASLSVHSSSRLTVANAL
jgi:hypothetical protein